MQWKRAQHSKNHTSHICSWISSMEYITYQKQAADLDPTTTTRVEEEEESGEKFTSQNPRYTCEGLINSTTLGFWVWSACAAIIACSRSVSVTGCLCDIHVLEKNPGPNFSICCPPPLQFEGFEELDFRTSFLVPGAAAAPPLLHGSAAFLLFAAACFVSCSLVTVTFDLRVHLVVSGNWVKDGFDSPLNRFASFSGNARSSSSSWAGSFTSSLEYVARVSLSPVLLSLSFRILQLWRLLLPPPPPRSNWAVLLVASFESAAAMASKPFSSNTRTVKCEDEMRVNRRRSPFFKWLSVMKAFHPWRNPWGPLPVMYMAISHMSPLGPSSFTLWELLPWISLLWSSRKALGMCCGKERQNKTNWMNSHPADFPSSTRPQFFFWGNKIFKTQRKSGKKVLKLTHHPAVETVLCQCLEKGRTFCPTGNFVCPIQALGSSRGNRLLFDHLHVISRLHSWRALCRAYSSRSSSSLLHLGNHLALDSLLLLWPFLNFRSDVWIRHNCFKHLR